MCIDELSDWRKSQGEESYEDALIELIAIGVVEPFAGPDGVTRIRLTDKPIEAAEAGATSPLSLVAHG